MMKNFTPFLFPSLQIFVLQPISSLIMNLWARTKKGNCFFLFNRSCQGTLKFQAAAQNLFFISLNEQLQIQNLEKDKSTRFNSPWSCVEQASIFALRFENIGPVRKLNIYNLHVGILLQRPGVLEKNGNESNRVSQAEEDILSALEKIPGVGNLRCGNNSGLNQSLPSLHLAKVRRDESSYSLGSHDTTSGQVTYSTYMF